jgi:hypothetical protein
MRHLVVILVISLSTPAFADPGDAHAKRITGGFALAGAAAAIVALTVASGLFGYEWRHDNGDGIAANAGIALMSTAWAGSLAIPGLILVNAKDREPGPPQLTLRF